MQVATVNDIQEDVSDATDDDSSEQVAQYLSYLHTPEQRISRAKLNVEKTPQASSDLFAGARRKKYIIEMKRQRRRLGRRLDKLNAKLKVEMQKSMAGSKSVIIFFNEKDEPFYLEDYDVRKIDE